jgi:hypothetical protein
VRRIVVGPRSARGVTNAGLALLVLGLLLAAAPKGRHARPLNLAAAGLAGLGLGLLALEYSERKTTVLDARGLHDRYGHIRWADVRGLRFDSVGARRLLTVNLPFDGYAARQNPHQGVEARAEIRWVVDVSVADASYDEIEAASRQWAAGSGEDGGSTS